jgi:hypothetical protein
MPQRRFGKIRSIVLAGLSAVAGILASVGAVSADCGGGPFP